MERSKLNWLVSDFRRATKLGIRYTSSQLGQGKTGYRTPVVRSLEGARVVVIDPNNEAVYFWARLWKYTKQPAKLIRIDRYSDMEKNDREPLRFSKGYTFARAKPEHLFLYIHHLGDQSFLEFAVQNKVIQPHIVWGDPLTETSEVYGYRADADAPFYQLSPEEVASQKELHDPSTPSVWDIDLVAFSSVYDASHTQEDIDQRIAVAESILRKARAQQKPACVTIAQSQTPTPYVPADTLAYVRDKTLEMVERVLR